METKRRILYKKDWYKNNKRKFYMRTKQGQIEKRINRMQANAKQFILVKDECDAEIKKLNLDIKQLEMLSSQASNYLTDSEFLDQEFEDINIQWCVYTTNQ